MRALRAAPWILFACAVAGVPPASGGPDSPPGGGPAYKDDALGLSLQGPAGWRMAAQKATVSTWTPLVTFSETTTGAEIVLSVRERKHATAEKLREAAQAEWSADKNVTLTSVQVVPAATPLALPSVQVEASQLVTPPAPPKPAAPGAVPPPPPTPVTWTVQATYWPAPGYEYRLLARSRATTWGRIRPAVEAVRASFALKAKESGPAGEGAYQDESRGFSCRYPTGYSVRIPKAKNHAVEFKGLAAEDPVLGVFHFPGEFPLENDAQALVKYYAEDQGGEASSGPVEVAGRTGLLVTARADVDGKPTTVFIAIVKRGDEFFRFRAAVPRPSESRGRKILDAFLSSVHIH